MGTKVFATYKDQKLISDERDVMVSAEHRTAVWDWCRENDIEVEMALGSIQSVMAATTFGVTLWRVKDERQRVMFLLRWS